VTGAVRIRYWM